MSCRGRGGCGGRMGDGGLGRWIGIGQGDGVIVSGREIKEKIERGWGGLCGEMGEGKLGFFKRDVARDEHTVGGGVEAAISFVIGGVAEKDAGEATWGEFVGCGGSRVRVT